MKILISPAKSIQFINEPFAVQSSIPLFENETLALVNKLKKMSVKKVEKLMHISNDLATLNVERFQSFEFPKESSAANHPAIFAFSGEVYRGFDAQSLTLSQADDVQNQLLILSGLYGILKPFDLFYPYRLEMGTSWEITSKNKNLYSFWKLKLTKMVQNELAKGEILVNLASVEYSKAVDFKQIKNNTIVPVFKEFKNGSYKTIAIFAKNARGKMARYIIENKCDTIEDLKAYNWDNYRFDETQSKGNELVFVR
jgi:uncharacterized protein